MRSFTSKEKVAKANPEFAARVELPQLRQGRPKDVCARVVGDPLVGKELLGGVSLSRVKHQQVVDQVLC